MVIAGMKDQRLTTGSWDYLEPHAYEVMKTIENPAIAGLHLMEG